MQHQRDSLLWAISQVESGGNDRARGKAGEVSRYQIMPGVWRSHSASRSYTNPTISSSVARKQLAQLETGYVKARGRFPSDADLAVMWQSGLEGYRRAQFTSTRLKPSQRDRLRRIMNLIAVHQQQTTLHVPEFTQK